MDRKEAGQQGESLALTYLEGKGLRLLKRNYRCRNGEIDLVMLDGVILALVEVRFRQDRAFGGAAASVQMRKQQHLLKTAQHLLLHEPALRRHRARFDVVAIEPRQEGAHIEWIRDAFRL